MIAGLSGSLLSQDALRQVIPDEMGAWFDSAGSAVERTRLSAWHARVTHEMGPACGARAVYDRVAVPLAEALGFRVTITGGGTGHLFRAVLETAVGPAAVLLVSAWGQDAAAVWREGVHHGIGAGMRWCLCVTGPRLRVLDARRTYSRRFLDIEIATTLGDPQAFGVVWGLLRAEAFAPADGSRRGALLDRAVTLSEQHRSAVRTSLQHGVHEALTSLVEAFAVSSGRSHASRTDARIFDESLVVVYRILFLLFAEARGLVPCWHPTYRNAYTIESLRPSIEQTARPRGLWESLQAIARLAHDGCRAGSLRVPPFNGRLFSPTHAPLADRMTLDDAAVRRALLALTTRRGRAGIERVAYGDLGVEQLGGVYERVLDFEPSLGARTGPTLVRGTQRKTTGSFYTPRSLTEYVVRRTLAPLVQGSTSAQILDLRVLDPAMGSGAFLVAACRYLASAYEVAVVREGARSASDLGSEDRAGFRRMVAQRCLFGVDINPMAVQLGRLSLWLATLSGDRPLTFLDHRLRAGNSLVGASLDDVARRAYVRSRGGAPPRALPLLEAAAADYDVGATVGPRLAIAGEAGDTIAQVRDKERRLSRLLDAGSPLARWKEIADLWCAQWFADAAAPSTSRAARRTFEVLVDEIVGRAPVLSSRTSEPLRAAAREVAARERFFHWHLEFPEVFYGREGRPLDLAGFDAVVGNPPWEMLRGDRGQANTSWMTGFARGSGIYVCQGDGHANLYQLFLERAWSLVRRGGRVGMVLPSGFVSDLGSAALRRHALDHTRIDTLTVVENRAGLFQVHRSLKFLLMTATAGAPTSVVPCRFGVRTPDVLDELADTGPDHTAVEVPRGLIERLSGPHLAIPEIRSRVDLDILERMAFSVPSLGDPDGWHVRFGRELNATDDRPHFVSAAEGRRQGLPVLEGKQIQPFVVDIGSSRFYIARGTVARLLDPDRSYGRPRLAYRDVASSTNRLTLIAAVIPADVVTTHTLFCLKGQVDADVQHFLCAMLNSFVANYLVRLRVGTHVTVSIIERLPVPHPARDSGEFLRLADLSRTLASRPDDPDAHAELQARAAGLYGLTLFQFQHVLDTLPLVPRAARAAAMRRFGDESRLLAGLGTDSADRPYPDAI